MISDELNKRSLAKNVLLSSGNGF